jgi:hypothetical protein
VRCAAGVEAILATAVRRTGEASANNSSVQIPRCTGQWEEIEVRTYVDYDADGLMVGVALQRAGKVWLDEVSVEGVNVPGEAPVR